MNVAVNILSTIIKSAVKSKMGNELANELIGISVDDVSEKGISKINDFINNERTKIEKILSKEKMKSMGISEDNIAYVIAEVRKLFSEIEITDEMFRQCRYDSLNLCSFLWKEYSENKTDYIEYESDIKKSLLAISEALIKIMRESEEFVKDISIQISNTVDDTKIEIQRISDYLEKNVGKISADNQMILDILREMLEQNQKNKEIKKSRTQEYADKWNANMFLNNFDKRDENAGVNVKLKDVYLEEHLPHYVWGNNESKSTDLEDLLTEYIEEHNGNKMLLILGQPGIGKSTLITWITANFNKRVDDIRVYQFASDLKNIEWKKNSITKSILESLGYLYNDLNGKILILDGLDEWSIQIDKKDILDNLYEDLIYKKNIKDFTLIVTCRENYIQSLYSAIFKYIVLKPWDEMQIKSFCSVFQNETKVFVPQNTMENIISNKNILGIPLVLYMVLALKITLENEGSIVDVYDRVFSLEGGIYDRCIDYKRFASPHRIGEVKRQIHQISRDIAIWMFENNPDKAYIPQEEYKKICINITHEGDKNKDLGQDFIIGNFFELKHCEGEKGEELYFVHRSIYEYFVVETIYNAIENSMKELSDRSQKELAANIVVYLKQGKITNTIGEYFQHKISRLLNQMCVEKKKQFYDWWESTIAKMIEDGMFFYTNKNISCYKNIMSKECQCFENLLKILRLLLDICKRKYMLENANRRILGKYIKYCLVESLGDKRVRKRKMESYSSNEVGSGGVMSQEEIERMLEETIERKSYLCLDQMGLREIDFEGMNLEDINLHEINLQKANLQKANLQKAFLRKIDLRKANLQKINLQEVYLEEVNLEGANLQGVNLTYGSLWDVNLECANLQGANLQGMLVKSDNYITHTKLRGSNLCNSNLSNADLRGVDLESVILSGAVLHRTLLERAKLNKAILLFTCLQESNLKKVIFNNADLRLADLRGADLHEADLKGANLMFAKFDEEQITYLTNYDLSKSLVYVEEYDRFVDYLKYQKMKNWC